MAHRFSLALVARYWFNSEKTNCVSSVVNNVRPLNYIRYGWAESKKMGLMSRVFFTLPQLLALDYYITMREVLPLRRQRHCGEVLKNALAELQELPEGGWDINRFRILAFKPHNSRDIFIVYGTHFTVAKLAAGRKDALFLKYKGTELMRRLKIAWKRKRTFGQRLGDDIYWGIRTPLEMKSARKWRKVPYMIVKKNYTL